MKVLSTRYSFRFLLVGTVIIMIIFSFCFTHNCFAQAFDDETYQKGKDIVSNPEMILENLSEIRNHKDDFKSVYEYECTYDIFLSTFYSMNSEPDSALFILEKYYHSIRDSISSQELISLYLSALGTLYNHLTRYEEAASVLSEHILLHEQLYGKDISYILYLNILCSIYTNLRDYEKAITICAEATDLQKNQLIEMDYYLQALLNLNHAYNDIGNYKKAKQTGLEAKDIIEKYYSNEHSEYFDVLFSLANTYFSESDFKNAEKYFEIIRQKGINHPYYGVYMSDYANYYLSTDNYDDAMQIVQDILPHTDTITNKSIKARIWWSIGDLYRKSEKFLEGEKYLIKSLEIVDEQYLRSRITQSLGEMYADLGDSEKAEKLLLQSLDIENLSDNNRSSIFNSLGRIYSSYGSFDNSINYFLSSLLLKNDSTSINYFITIGNLAYSYFCNEDYKEAEKYYLKAINGIRLLLGDKHSLYASTINNFGMYYFDIQEFDESENYFLQALSIANNISDPLIKHIYANLFTLYFAWNKYDLGLRYFVEYNNTTIKDVERNFLFLSNKQRDIYWNRHKSVINLSYCFLSVLSTYEPLSIAYNNALFSKGLLLRSTNEIRNAILSSGNQTLISQYGELRAIRQLINTLQSRTDNYDLNVIETLEVKADSLDKALTIESSDYRDMNTDLNIEWKDIRDNLSDNEVAIEFIDYQLFDKEWTDTILYAALVLRSGMEAPVWIPLCEENDLKAFFAKTKGILDNRRDADEQKTRILYTIYGNELYNLIWQPLEQYLQGIETIYYSPSGILNQIAFSAIPVDTARLMDKYDLHLVSSTREVVNKKKLKDSFLPINQSVLYGGIRYNADTQELQTAASPYKEIPTPLFTSRSLPEDVARFGWEDLQGTVSEVVEIKNILEKFNIKSIAYMGIEANEESFKALSGNSPMLLHIATHGFFLQDEKKIRQIGIMQLMGENRIFSNPLLRSGLLFAGANRAWLNKDIIPDIEDGILTAEEIAHLDLSNTKLVVLSACETGLGEVQNSEGVFGLQRAFKLAGVETLIMSLWKVPDEATSKLMIDFYQNLLSGKSKQESFKKAQQTIREEYQNPYYWAGFVMMD